MSVLDVTGGSVLADSICCECKNDYARLWLFQLTDEETEHLTAFCEECLCRALSRLTGFRFSNQLAAWKASRQLHLDMKLERMVQRGKKPIAS